MDGIPLTEHEGIKLTGDVIRRLRKERGWTQEDLAQRLGVSVSTVANWENERTNPGSAKRAIEIVTMLNLDFEPSDPMLLQQRYRFEVNPLHNLAAIKPDGEPPMVYKIDAFVTRWERS